MQQPQDLPNSNQVPETDLLAEMEKNRILRAALANNEAVTAKYRKRSRELSRL